MKNIEKLREHIKKECLGAYFGGGFGGALMEMSDIEHASEEELLEMAEQQGIDLSEYQI